MSPLRALRSVDARFPRGFVEQAAAAKNHEYFRTNPSIIYSRFMSKTEVVHWRFDCRVYVFVDCSFPLLILSALYLYCYHWSFALPFTVHLIFGQVGAKPTHCRSGTGNKITIETLLFYRKPLGRLNRSFVQCYGSSRNPNSLIAFASLTFIVVIRCAIAGDVLLWVMATIASACLVHLLFLRHLV